MDIENIDDSPAGAKEVDLDEWNDKRFSSALISTLAYMHNNCVY